MLHLNARLKFYVREHLRMDKNAKEKMHFILHLMIHLTVLSRGAPNDGLSNLHKDAQEGVFEVALNGALVHLMVDLMLH